MENTKKAPKNVKKKTKRKRGFTMVELLAVIVIVGVISVLGIVGVSRYISDARNAKEQEEKDNIAMAARLYMQANRELLPRTIGDSTSVQVSELRRTNYLKEDVKDQYGKSCMKKSFVRVYKLDEKEYSYRTYLYCGDVEVPPEVEVPRPEIVNFKFNGYGANGKFTNVKNASFSFKIKGSHDDTTIGVYSYSYTIYAKSSEEDSAKYTEVYYSGDIKAGYEPSIEIVSKVLSSYFDVTGYNAIRINISAVNEQGGKVEFSSDAGSFQDTDKPLCGLITGQALSDEDWVNKTTFNSGTYKNNYRRITVACNDDFGSGCKRDNFTVSWPNDTQDSVSGIDYSYGARWSYVTLSDNARDTNSTRCYVRANVDVKAPEVRVTVYKAKADGSRDGKVAELVVRDDGKRTSVLPSGTLKQDQYLNVVGADAEKWLNKENYPYGVVIDANVEDNLYLYSYEWAVNNAYVAGGSSNATISGTASVQNANTEGGTASTGTFESTGMTDNPTNDTQLATAEHGVQTGSINGLVLKREGKRYGRLTVCDKAKNCTTVHIYANIDRTPPLVPTASYEKLTSHTPYTAATASDYLATTKWSNEYVRPYISGQREDRQTENSSVQVSLSGWDHFTYSYKRQNGKNNSGLTWAAAKTGDVYNPFGGTTQYGFDIKDQGTHKVAFRSCDKAGNCSSYSEEDYPKVDTVKPTCGVAAAYTGTTGPNSAGWLKSGESVTLSHTCADEDSKFSSGCNASDYHNQQTYNFNSDINTSKAGANGYNSVYGANDNTAGGHVVDYAGNISQECPKMTVKIDHIAPNCAMVISYPQGDPLNPTDTSKIETGWLGLLNGIGPTKKTAVVSLACTDVDSPSTSLMAAVKSNCDSNNASNKQSHIYNTEMNIMNAGAGGAGVGGRVYDIAGNVTNCPADRTVKIDYTVPVCTTQIDYGTGANAANFTQTSTKITSDAGWLGWNTNADTVKEMAKVSQVCSDPNGNQKSGCYGTMRYKIYDYNLNTNQAGAVGVGDSGFVQDTAGNKGDCSINGNWKTVKIDYVRPVCAVTVTSSGSGNGYNWTNSNYTGGWLGRGASVKIQSTCTSAESGTGASSGCATNTSKTYSTEMSVTTASSAGATTDFYVYDKADNRSAAYCARKTVRIDLSGPTCKVESKYGTSSTNSRDYNGDWIRGTNKVYIISYCQEDKLGNGAVGSGCSETNRHTHEFSVAEGNILNTNGGSSDNGGAYIIKDAVGNSTTCDTKPIKIDYQAPTCQITATKAGGGSYGSDSWTNQDVTISRTCRDGSGSGCASDVQLGTSCPSSSNTNAHSYTYTAGSGAVKTYSNAGADGVGCVVKVKDTVGNVRDCAANYVVKIDKQVPTCTIATTNTGGWTNKNVTIQGTCHDGNGSGCKTTSASLKVTFTTNTDDTAYYYSKPLADNAGNTSTCSGGPYIVQTWKTKPKCTAEKYDSSLNSPDGVKVSLVCETATGNGTGPQLKKCSGHNATGAAVSAHYPEDTGLKSSKTYTVTDEAGNSNTCKVTVHNKYQNRYAVCATCARCSSASCEKYKYCQNSACGTGYAFKGYTYSTCASTYGKGCYEYDSTNTRWHCKCPYTKSCRTSGCGCETRSRSCSLCGCETWSSGYTNWYDGSHSAGWSGKTYYERRTVYY